MDDMGEKGWLVNQTMSAVLHIEAYYTYNFIYIAAAAM